MTTPISAEERCRQFHLEVLGALTDAGICTPAEGYLKLSSPRVGSDIRTAIRQAEAAAEQRGYRRGLEEAAQAATSRFTEAWPDEYREAGELAAREIRALAKDSEAA